MSDYEILPVDPTVAFIVTIDDQPVQNADGRTLLFYREVDAQRCIDKDAGEEGDVTDFVRHVVRIPVSDEMLFDFGFAGPRFRSIPDRDRWTQAWQESQRNNWPFTFFRSAPPWENWDQPATPNTLTFWPRLEALVARLTAVVKRVKTERRRFRYRLIGARDGFLLRTDDDDRWQ